MTPSLYVPLPPLAPAAAPKHMKPVSRRAAETLQHTNATLVYSQWRQRRREDKAYFTTTKFTNHLKPSFVMSRVVS